MKNNNKMGAVPIPKLLIMMAIPITLSMFMENLYGMLDSYFIAQISDKAFTAIAMIEPIWCAMIAVASGTSVGINALLARSLGMNDKTKADDIARHSLFLTLLMSVIFAVLGITCSYFFFRMQTDDLEIINHGMQYLIPITVLSCTLFPQFILQGLLIATGKTKYSMIAQLTGAIVDIILNPIMIFGFGFVPAMGVLGGAIATLVGGAIASMVAYYFNIKKNTEISLSLRGFKPSWATVKEIYSMGMPALITYILFPITHFVLNLCLAKFSMTAVAVAGIYGKYENIIMTPIQGITSAIIPIIAYNYAAERFDRVKQAIKTGAIIGESITLLGFIIFIFFSEPLLNFYKATPEMAKLGTIVFPIISTNFLVLGCRIVCGSCLQALSEGKKVVLLLVVRQIGIIIPLAITFTISRNYMMIFWVFTIAEIPALCMCFSFLKNAIEKKGQTLTNVLS